MENRRAKGGEPLLRRQGVDAEVKRHRRSIRDVGGEGRACVLESTEAAPWERE